MVPGRWALRLFSTQEDLPNCGSRLKGRPRPHLLVDGRQDPNTEVYGGPSRRLRAPARRTALCLGSRRSRWGEPWLWGARRKGPHWPSAGDSARCSPGRNHRTAAERENRDPRGRGVVPARPKRRSPSRENRRSMTHLHICNYLGLRTPGVTSTGPPSFFDSQCVRHGAVG